MFDSIFRSNLFTILDKNSYRAYVQYQQSITNEAPTNSWLENCVHYDVSYYLIKQFPLLLQGSEYTIQYPRCDGKIADCLSKPDKKTTLTCFSNHVGDCPKICELR
jgi:hypothetical protein